MKPAPFRYHDPATLADAVELLTAHENAKLLAGGQSLVPMLNMRFASPDHLVDLNGIPELSGISEAPGVLKLGAMTRQRDIEFSALVAEACPILGEAIRLIGHRQTRNRGTIGGSLCNLDPSAELVCVCAALDASLDVMGPEGVRTIEFADFPLAYMTPSIEANEILVEVRLPRWHGASGSAFVEFSRRHGDFAIVSAAAILRLDGSGCIDRAALCFGGVNVAPQRMYDIEESVVGMALTPEALNKAADACRGVDALEDAYVSSAYRQHLATVMGRRALLRAAARASSAHSQNEDV